MTQQTKDEAREEALRRWRALPPTERQTIDQAQIFAAALAAELDFRTMGNSRMVILGWLVRDLDGLPAWGNIPPESQPQPVRDTAPADPAPTPETAEAQPEEQTAPESDNDNDADDDHSEARRHAAE